MTPVPASAKKEDRKAAVTAGLPAQSAVGESCAPDSYVQAPQGLFPAPMHPKDAKGSKTVERFRCLGRAMAKALQDSRLLDIPFSYTFYRCSSSPLRQVVAIRTAGMNMVLTFVCIPCGRYPAHAGRTGMQRCVTASFQLDGLAQMKLLVTKLWPHHHAVR